MNWKSWAPLAVAVVLGLFAARLAMNMINTTNAHEGPASAAASMVVATRDLTAGTLLSGSDLKTIQTDAASIPASAFNSPHMAENRVLVSDVAAGVPLVSSMLAAEGSSAGVPALLKPGYRAISVEVSEVKGATDFIQPRCRVDVVTTVIEEGANKPVARTLLEDVTVLAVGSRMSPNAEPSAEPSRTITLLVTPPQAELLELATSTTKVRLIMRNSQDDSRLGSHGTSVADLKGKGATDPAAAILDMIRRISNPLFPAANAGSPAGGLLDRVPSDMRAMSIEVTEVKGVTDFIQPKSRIDLLTTVAGTEADKLPVTKTILENITVLATGLRIDSPMQPIPEPTRTLTLLLTPEQAESLELAMQGGRVRVTLRGQARSTTTDGTKLASAEVVGGQKSKGTRSVRVIRGNTITTQTFPIDTPAAGAAGEPKHEIYTDVRD